MRRSLLVAGLALLLPVTVAAAGVLANVDVSWNAFADGGTSQSTSTIVVDAVGQPAAGVSASSGAIIEAGVLALPLGDTSSTASRWLYLPQAAKR